MKRFLLVVTVMVTGSPACAQSANDPFPDPIEATEDVVVVNYTDFATVPDIDGEPARMMLLVDEPGTGRMFVNDMRGPLYSVSYEGAPVREYVNINDPRWGVSVEHGGRERGFQSFAFHPQFAESGTPGYGKFYTWTDSDNTAPAPDYAPRGDGDSHDTVLHEWTAQNPAAETYDGGAPREMLRLQQPYGNHNAGHIAFNPTASPGEEDFGLLYVGIADGGSGGDPLNLAQDLGSAFGKVFRIDPLGTNGPNGEYGIPADNPFVGDRAALDEIYAYGVRNPQRFGWDPVNGNMYLADIGQNIVEELSPVTAGANLGWNDWEGSFGFISRSEVDLSDPRGDSSVTYPIAEFSQLDPLLQGSSAATGVHVHRSSEVPQLNGLILFGDFPSGEIFYVPADDTPDGGQDAIRRVLLDDGGQARTFLEVIRAKNETQGRRAATRADLRFGDGPNGQLFLLNKHDGTIRLVRP